MRRVSSLLCVALLEACALAPTADATVSPADVAWSEGSVDVGGQHIDYRAAAGTLTVHPAGWEDATATHDGPEDAQAPTASMFYVAYFRKGAQLAQRPLTFVYGGGPGSPTHMEHLALFGPKRVAIRDALHTAAPYRLVDNPYSLLDASDVVFIDAPGTGFSSVRGRDKEQAFFGVDADAHAFAEFINAFLTSYSRWKSPKFIFGQSYGTPRSAVLANLLQSRYNIDVTGVILLSQVLNFDLGAGAPQFNPGTDQPYITTLPSYAAVAWYYNRLPAPRPPDLPEFLRGVEQFALTDYTIALQAGSTLEPDRREAIARHISELTGLPKDYVLKSDLRIDVGQFRKMLLEGDGVAVGQLDARFSGPVDDPTAKEAGPDPAGPAFGAAYVAIFNDYVRGTLGYGGDRVYKHRTSLTPLWRWDRDQPPHATTRVYGMVNVMPDLAAALKANPDLRVMVNGGYFDLDTPYFEGQYEMHHLPIPASLQSHIEYHYYMAGHMVYIHEPALEQMHGNVADFIRRASHTR